MMKRIMAITALTVILSGCSIQQSSDQIQRQQQEVILKESTAQTGMPDIKNFFERKTMKKIIEKRDNPDLTTYAYTQAMNGKFIYIGRTVGYGLPYSTQYTNPQKVETDTRGVTTLPQADPNGLFSPPSTNATWLLVVNEQTNETQIMYAEPNIVVTESKLPARLCESWSLPTNY